MYAYLSPPLEIETSRGEHRNAEVHQTPTWKKPKQPVHESGESEPQGRASSQVRGEKVEAIAEPSDEHGETALHVDEVSSIERKRKRCANVHIEVQSTVIRYACSLHHHRDLPLNDAAVVLNGTLGVRNGERFHLSHTPRAFPVRSAVQEVSNQQARHVAENRRV